MSLEIKELEIRMRINDDKADAEPKPTSQPPGECGGCSGQAVDESVRRVLQALRTLEER